MRGPVLNNLASVYHSMGMTDSAIVYFERSLKIRRDNEDAYGTARVLDNMGEVLLSVGGHQRSPQISFGGAFYKSK